MPTYLVPMGHNRKVPMEILSREEAQKRGLKETSVNGATFIKPGEMFITNVEKCPIIIAVAGPDMMVAHTKNNDSVETLTASIRGLMINGFPKEKILICMLFGNQELELAFLERARLEGVLYAWTMLRSDSFRTLVCADELMSLILVKHDA